MYPVRVCEEQIIVSKGVKLQCFCKSHRWKYDENYNLENDEDQSTDKGSRLEEENGDVEVDVDNELDKRYDVEEA